MVACSPIAAAQGSELVVQRAVTRSAALHWPTVAGHFAELRTAASSPWKSSAHGPHAAR